MEANDVVVEELGFKDRKVRLVVFGALQIILGCFSALAVVLMVASTLLSATLSKGAAQGVPLKTMIPGILLYVLAAVWFISMGFGSIQAKRWARALILVSSWLWLIIGMIGFSVMLFLLPKISEQMGQNGNLPKEAVVVMKIVMLTTMAVIYVAIPGVLVLVYSGKNVKATCEHRDRHVRWTDKCPLPVLAASIICALGAVSMLSMVLYGRVIMFFGTVLSGLPGVAVILVAAAIFVYAAWGLYKLDIKAWWVAVLVYAGWTVSNTVTWSGRNLQLFYEKMDLPEQQLNNMKQFGFLFSPAMRWFFILWAVVLVGYFVWIKKYFKHSRPDSAVSDSEMDMMNLE